MKKIKIKKSTNIYKIFNIAGLIFLLIALIPSKYFLLRLVVGILAYLSFIISIFINKRNKLYYKILAIFLLFVIIYGGDYCCFTILKKIPAFIIKRTSSNSVATYDSLFYRIYDCNGNLYHDSFYSERFMCSEDSLDTFTINEFLIKPEENFNKYEHKFVKIKGKISKIIGSNKLEMEKYLIDSSNTLNGYVLFNTSCIINAELDPKIDLTENKIYDEITIIGRVSKLKKTDNGFTIILADSKVVNSDLYSKFTVDIKKNNDTSKIYISNNYYITGVDYFNLKYNDANIYELKYALLDKKVTLEDFIDLDISNIKENTLIKKENYNILICANHDILFGSTSLNVNNINCPNVESSE